MATNQDGTPLCSDCDGWCLIPPAEALGWPKNLGHATSPHEAQLARFAQTAAALVALSATNEPLEADLTVTAGHRHDTEETAILWRQLGQWALTSQSSVGVQSIGLAVSGVTPRLLCTLPFRVPLSAGGTAAPLRVIYPRVRVSVLSGTPSTMQLTGDVVKLLGGIASVAVLPPLRVRSQAAPAVTFVNRWLSFGPVEIPEAALVAAGGRLALQLIGSTDNAGETGTLFEASVGLLGGL